MPESTQQVTVGYTTSSATATEGTDYTATSGTLTFAVGETTKTITVPATEDAVFEDTETFTLTLSSPVNAAFVGGRTTLDAVGTILEDDPEPPAEVSATWPLVPSAVGAGGSFRLLFASSYTRDATSPNVGAYNAHVQQAAGNGHASIRNHSSRFRVLGSTAAVDARDNTGTTVAANDTGVAIYWLNGDQVADDYSDLYDGSWDSNAVRNESGNAGAADVQFHTGSNADGTKHSEHPFGSVIDEVRVGNPAEPGGEIDSTNASIFDARGLYGLSGVFRVQTGGSPTLSIRAMPAEEGHKIKAIVSLLPPSTQEVTVTYATSSGTATEGTDYTATSGTLTFQTGQTTKEIEVDTTNDQFYEGVETFTITLSGVVNAAFVGGRSTLDAVARILDEGDAILPALTSATVDGAALGLAYDAELDESSVPVPGDVIVKVNDVPHAIYLMTIRGTQVDVVLEEAVMHGDTVIISYQPGSSPIRHIYAFQTEPLVDVTVTNNTPPAPPTGTDRAALTAFYNATSGVNWENNDNWRSNMPLDQWYGVGTDTDGRVTSLHLESNRLEGIVPPEMLQLTRLRELEIAFNESCLPGDAAFDAWVSQVEFDGAYCPPEEKSEIDIAIFYTPAAKKQLAAPVTWRHPSRQ